MVSYDVVMNRRAMVIDASTLADMVADNSTAALTFHDVQAAQDVLRSLRTQPHVTAACLYTQDGQVFATYVRDGKDSNFSAPRPRQDGSFFENGRLLVFRPVRLADDSIGTVYLESDFSEMNARLRTYPVVIGTGAVDFLGGGLPAGGATAKAGFRAHSRTGADRRREFPWNETTPCAVR